MSSLVVVVCRRRSSSLVVVGEQVRGVPMESAPAPPHEKAEVWPIRSYRVPVADPV